MTCGAVCCGAAVGDRLRKLLIAETFCGAGALICAACACKADFSEGALLTFGAETGPKRLGAGATDGAERAALTGDCAMDGAGAACAGAACALDTGLRLTFGALTIPPGVKADLAVGVGTFCGARDARLVWGRASGTGPTAGKD